MKAMRDVDFNIPIEGWELTITPNEITLKPPEYDTEHETFYPEYWTRDYLMSLYDEVVENKRKAKEKKE